MAGLRGTRALPTVARVGILFLILFALLVGLVVLMPQAQALLLVVLAGRARRAVFGLLEQKGAWVVILAVMVGAVSLVVAE